METARDLLVLNWIRQRDLERWSGASFEDQNPMGVTL